MTSSGVAPAATISSTGACGRALAERVAAEVLGVFVAYEEALVRNDVEAMTGWFWNTEDVVRFGICDAQRGAREVLQWRETAGGVPPGRTLSDTDVLVLGPDTAVVTTRFGYPEPGSADVPATGRQTQVWARVDGAWRVVSAHVSEQLPGAGE